jgi:hypothetical protein
MLRARAVLLSAVVGFGVGPALSAVTTHADKPPPAPRVAALPHIPAAHVAAPSVLVAPPTTTTTVITTTTRAAAKPRPKGDSITDKNKVDTRPKPAAAGLPLGSPFIGKYVGTEIEGYARYEGQSTCDPTPKLGTLALRDLLLARYPNTSSLGISRNCDVGGQSEHKDGRAFDWGAKITSASQVASVEDFLTALFATDSAGHPHALARRMGIMYVIWNQRIWGAYDAQTGWRPYDGSNPHTDHMHISLSWAGARGETSFWSGTVVPGLPDGTRPDRYTRRTTTTTTRRSTTTTTWQRHHHDDWPTTTTSTPSPTTSSSTTTTTLG